MFCGVVNIGRSSVFLAKVYHGPVDPRHDTCAIPSMSTISFFLCFRSRYRQPGRITRPRRLWQDGLLRVARYARRCVLRSGSSPLSRRTHRPANGRPISNSTSALENAFCHSTCRPRLVIVVDSMAPAPTSFSLGLTGLAFYP